MRVRQIDTALDVLELFARERTPLTLTAIAQELGIPKSSTFNIIETLLLRGYLFETRPRAGYYPTALLSELAREIAAADPLVQRLHPELESLAAATGETVVLSTREQGDIVYLDTVESESSIRYFARIGQRRPIHTTSSGKAILASYETNERASVLAAIGAGLDAVDAKALAVDIDQSAARGWSEDRGHTQTDVMGFGVALKTKNWRLGLAVAGPRYRLEGKEDQLLEKLLASRDRMLGAMATAKYNGAV